MKKWVVGIFLFLVLLFAVFYMVIPTELQLTKQVKVKGRQTSISRVLGNENAWKQWWPGHIQQDEKNKTFIYQTIRYEVAGNFFNGVVLLMGTDGRKEESSLTVSPLLHDSSLIVWQGRILTGLYPFQKLVRYKEAKQIERSMDSILSYLQMYLNKTENIYGFHIEQTMVKDTILVVTKATSIAYPSTKDIYKLINQVHNYIAQQGATEQNYPMLHVQQKDNNHYETMVAIPVNKRLPEGDNLFQRRMVPGYILVTEVKGGPATIKAAFDQLENYIVDYNKSSPAIPFESLVTNRLAQPDTSKWITRIYYPIY